MPPPSVRHNEAARRFEAETPAGTALLEYVPGEGSVSLTHTEVPEAAEGEGVASALAEAALAWARAEGLRVAPVCRFVQVYLRRHPEHADLTGGGDR